MRNIREKSKGLQRIYKNATQYCVYCGKKMKQNEKTIDHIKPISKSGITSSYNIVCCCKKCNKNKSNNEISKELLEKVKNKQNKDLKIHRQKKNNQINKSYEQKLLNNDKLRIYQLRIVLRRVIKRRNLNIGYLSEQISWNSSSLKGFINNESGIEKEEYLKLYSLLQNELTIEKNEIEAPQSYEKL